MSQLSMISQNRLGSPVSKRHDGIIEEPTYTLEDDQISDNYNDLPIQPKAAPVNNGRDSMASLNDLF